MAWTQDLECETFKAEVSFSGMQYRIVELSTTAPNQAKLAGPALGGGYGVLQNEPLINEAATVAVEGHTRLKVGTGGVAIGDYVICANSNAGGSGWAMKVTSGDAMPGATMLIGRARSAAASGSIFTCALEIRRLTVDSAGKVVL